MSQGLFKKYHQKGRLGNWTQLILMPFWIVLSFFAAQFMAGLLIYLLAILNVDFESINQSLLSLVLSAVVYIFMICFAIGLPRFIKKRQTTTLEDLGLDRLPSWKDILLSPLALVVYAVISILLSTIISNIFTGIDMEQVQETGFDNLSQNYEYYLAFIALVILAPVAEEVIFRGYLFGKLKKSVPVWAAIVVTSITFGAVHGAWNLAIDTFALSVVMCLLREYTGSIWSSILLHMMKNGIAYYFLFINTTLLTTLGG